MGQSNSRSYNYHQYYNAIKNDKNFDFSVINYEELDPYEVLNVNKKFTWEELKVNLDSKPWISPSQNVDLLNQTTEVINFWQESDKKVSLKEAREKFSNCLFAGH